MIPSHIQLDIHELVLEGIEPRDQHLRGQVIRELVRLLREHGLPTSLVQSESEQARGSLSASITATADTVEPRQIAAAIHQALKQ